MLVPSRNKPDFDLTTTIVFLKIKDAIEAVATDDQGNVLLDEHGKPVRLWKYIILEGSSRSSKTYSAIDNVDLYARSKQHKRITIWRDTKTDAVATVYADMESHLKKTGRWLKGFRFHGTTHTLFYDRSDSRIEIKGTDDISAHGLNQSVAWINEPYKVGRVTFDQIDQRTDDFILIDWNPKEAHWIDDLKKHPRAIVIHSTFKDNPFCPSEQRIKILGYQPVSMTRAVTSKIMKEHEAQTYDTVANPLNLDPKMIRELVRCQANESQRTADKFNWEVYGLGLKSERPHRIFRWEEISLQEYQQLDVKEWFYSDWGSVDPWAVAGAKYMDGCLYLNELNYASENEIRAILTTTEKQQLGLLERSQGDEGKEAGLVTWYFHRFGIPKDGIIACDPNRPTKIRALRKAGYDYAVAAPKPPGSIIDGIDLLNDIRVCYTSTSKNIKYEQENYSRKVDRYGIVQEEPEDTNNHHMDGSRYVATLMQAQGIIRKI